MSEATPTRRQQIVILLQTRDEGLPTPVRHDAPAAGFVHRTTVRESCPDCLANDRPVPGCATCGGRGYLEEERQRDPYAIEKVQPYGMDPAKYEAGRERDRQIDRLGEQLAPSRSEADLLAAANARPDGWEQARRRMYQRYDYGALDQALDRLREQHQAAYHVLHSVYVYGWQTTPGPAMLAVAEAGVVFLDERLLAMGVDPIRAPGSLREAQEQLAAMRRARGRSTDRRALEARNAEMRRLHHTEGLGVGELVARFAVGTSTVYAVVNGEER